MIVRRLGHSVLRAPAAYELFQRALGGPALRRRIVGEFVRPASGARILDLGCAGGRLLDCLPQGVEYTGVDVSTPSIEAGRARYGERARFIASDARTVDVSELAGRADIVLAIALLHHLDDEGAAAVVETADRHLRPGGRFVALDAALVAGQAFLARWLIERDQGEHSRRPDEYAELIAQRFEVERVTTITDGLRVPYTHVIVEARKRA